MFTILHLVDSNLEKCTFLPFKFDDVNVKYHIEADAIIASCECCIVTEWAFTRQLMQVIHLAQRQKSQGRGVRLIRKHQNNSQKVSILMIAVFFFTSAVGMPFAPGAISVFAAVLLCRYGNVKRCGHLITTIIVIKRNQCHSKLTPGAN
jgi:hypothetical protein